MEEIRKLVSIQCKKDMKIKIIDKKEEQNNQNTNGAKLDFNGININIIDD